MTATIEQHAEPAEPSDYLLDRKVERERLIVQSRVWEPAAETMIDEIGVIRGWRCADLACGAIGVLRPLARAAGALGSVIGIDNDPGMLEISRDWVRQQSLDNVWLLEGDAYDTALPRGAFDLVHTRFLFAPVGRDRELLAEMIDLAKPGGIVAAQEPDSASWNCYPRRAGWDGLKPAILRAFRSGGGDFDAGTRLYDMMRRAGLEDVQVRTHVLALPPGHPYRRSPVQFAASLRNRIIAGGLLSAQQLNAAIADCETAAADAATIFNTFTLTQAWGRKPH